MEVLLCLLITIVSALNILCLVIGAKIGQAVSKGERIELPKVDPMKPIRESQDRKQAEREQDRYDTIMRNIERYDGTPNGQEDVPRG